MAIPHMRSSTGSMTIPLGQTNISSHQHARQALEEEGFAIMPIGIIRPWRCSSLVKWTMKRRWKLWTGLALLPVLGLGFLHPAVYWPLIGWIRGEAFYQGRPTSFWQSEIRNRYIDLADSSLPMWTCLPSWWEGWLERIGMGSQLPWLDRPPLLKGDPA